MIRVILLIAVFVGLCFLESYLSKSKNKWLGRILPIFSFSLSVIITLIYLLNFMAGTQVWQVILTLILVFVIYNIPTVIFVVIYKCQREKLAKNSEIDKTRIQDL